jgi:mercuric ion binding protein
MKKLIFCIALTAVAGPLSAAPQIVTLSVPGMDCAVCPITIKKALMKVQGVSKATVNLEKREAVVTFDDAATSISALTRATTDAGYPSFPNAR